MMSSSTSSGDVIEQPEVPDFDNMSIEAVKNFVADLVIVGSEVIDCVSLAVSLTEYVKVCDRVDDCSILADRRDCVRLKLPEKV